MSQDSTPPPAASRPLTRQRPDWPEEVVYHGWRMGLVRVVAAAVVIVVVGGGGVLIGRWKALEEMGGGATAVPAADDGIAFWTCAMHPQIKLPTPGQCPICFMDLTPVRKGQGGGDSEGRIALSERARKLAQVATAEVQSRALTHTVRLVGKVAPDETRIKYISSYIPGRIDRLFVNYTGIFVKKGDHLAEVYSPQLLVAQREYLIAYQAAKKSGTTTAPATGGATAPTQTMLDAARTRLELWGVPKDQIAELERRGSASDHMRIDAPQEGWVLERTAFEGLYAETGMRLFSLVDLRQVWVQLWAYELDLPFVRIGQSVEFEVEALPGRIFAGTVSYIDPTLNETTRAVKVRVNVPNEDLALKPGMFVRASLEVRIGGGGAVIAPSLAGKWLCYMHTEVIKDAAGTCDVCGMELVTAESLHLATSAPAAPTALVVPQSAVLLTGERAIVYVEHPPSATSGSLYEPRAVKLGPRVGDEYIVLEGLTAGERVVARGAVLIDSAVQIQGQPSMMSADESAKSSERTIPEIPSRAVAEAKYHQPASAVIDGYLRLADALANDKLDAASAFLAAMRDAIQRATPDGLEGAAREDFQSQVSNLKSALDALPKTPVKDIAALRIGLPKLTAAMHRFVRTFGHTRPSPVYRVFCPMAFDDKGAEWLQTADEIANPYFGHEMLRCGEIRGKIAADGRETK